MRCQDCRKKVDLTRWERFKYSILERFFQEELKDVRADIYTKGISDGYTLGMGNKIDLDKRYDKKSKKS